MMKWISIFLLAGALTACSAPPVSTSVNQKEAASHQDRAAMLVEQGVEAYLQRNDTEAMTIFTQASAAGNIKAPRYIGLMYLNGYGVEQNARRAVAEFNKAAVQGDATAQYWLAYCYEQGIGIERNNEQALRWYRQVAQSRDAVAAPAMTALGRLAEVEQPETAIEWYQKAADIGDKEAQAALARLHDE